jgi:hypothetical protein
VEREKRREDAEEVEVLVGAAKEMRIGKQKNKKRERERERGRESAREREKEIMKKKD